MRSGWFSPFHSAMAEARSDGLDLARAVAILLVMFGHFSAHGDPPGFFVYVNRMGGLGVDVFFALSGFLIGGIVLRLMEAGRFNLGRDLGAFWARRWLRTLPLYFFFILLYMQFDWRRSFSFAEVWTHFFFMQNLTSTIPAFFELSWSLSVEEWFYVLFPAVLFFAARYLAKARAVAVVVVLFSVVGLAMRIALPFGPEVESFRELRTMVVYRLDATIFGVAVAGCRHFSSGVWNGMVRSFPAICVATLGVFVYCALSLPGSIQNPPVLALFFSFMPFVFAITLPGLAVLKLENHSWLRGFVRTSSVLSYSLYLGHILVIVFCKKFVLSPLGEELGHSPPWWVVHFIFFVASYAFAYVTYRGVEAPILNWRDRVFSGNGQAEKVSAS